MIAMIPYVLAFIVPALTVIFVNIRQSLSRKLAELEQEELANVHKELLEREIFERQIENNQYRYRTLSGDTIRSSITVSPDGVRIESDKIAIDEVHGCVSARLSNCINDGELRSATIEPKRTNCPNCGAVLSGHVCKYCGTHA